MNVSVLAIPVAMRQSSNIAADMSESSTEESNALASPLANFTTDEIRSLQSNDAMAAGVIATILGMAFLVLLSLAITVSVWTFGVTA